MKCPQYFVGIDLHKVIIQVCVLDDDGEIVEERRLRSDSLEEGLEAVELVKRFSLARVAVEAVGMNRWLVNAFQRAGIDIVVVDPFKLNLRMLGKKTDRRDAFETARRLRLGDIDRSAKTYFPTDEEYGVRKLLRTRHKLISLRQQVSNQIRALLRAYRVPAPSGVLYSKRAVAALRQLDLVNEHLGLCAEVLVDALEQLQGHITRLGKSIDEVAKAPKAAALVAELPGIGPQSAVTLIYELGDVSRFRSTRAVASYAGLVPRVTNSADKHHHGPITKRGNPELRWILGQWAVRLLHRHELVRQWALPMRRRMCGSKIRVALARKLLVGIYILLRRGEAFSFERCLGMKPQASAQ